MRLYNLPSEALWCLDKRLKAKMVDRFNPLTVARILDRIDVELNYRIAYGEDYEDRGIQKIIFK